MRLRGLASARQKLASGKVVTYYYAWRGGPRLTAKFGTPEFIAQYNAAVASRLPAPLAEGLDRNPKHGVTLFNNSDGLPWTSDGFRTSFGKACDKAQIAGLTFHDLRGTFANRAAAASCTPSEIASVTGHEIEGTGSLGASYLHRSLELATNCIRRLEENEVGTILQNGLQNVANRPLKAASSKTNLRGRKPAISKG